MKAISVASTVAIVFSLCACAAHRAQQPIVAKSAAPVAAKPAPATAIHSASAAPSLDAKQAEVANYAHSMGYKSVTRNGKPVWCKTEAMLGTHFETPSCVTDAVILEQKRMAAQNQQDIIWKRNCGGPTCNADGVNK